MKKYQVGDKLDQDQLDGMDRQGWMFGLAEVYFDGDDAYLVKDMRVTFWYNRRDVNGSTRG